LTAWNNNAAPGVHRWVLFAHPEQFETTIVGPDETKPISVGLQVDPKTMFELGWQLEPNWRMTWLGINIGARDHDGRLFHSTRAVGIAVVGPVGDKVGTYAFKGFATRDARVSVLTDTIDTDADLTAIFVKEMADRVAIVQVLNKSPMAKAKDPDAAKK
jgi:hypothetical protein